MAQPLKLATPTTRYNQQAVDYLTDLLARAQSGEVVEMIATVRTTDGMWDHCWTGCENLMELVGVLEREKLATLRRMDGC